MSSRLTKGLITSIALISTLSIMAFAPKEQKYRDELRPIMQTLFVSVQEVLPYYLDRSEFQDEKNAEKISKLLGNIQEHAKAIDGKTADYDEEMKLYGANFETDAIGAHQSFQRKAYGQSYFYLEEVLTTCFSCHASRASEKDSKFADLTGKIDWDKVGEFNKPKLFTISRQFDKAAKEYENMILDRGLSMEELLHFDPFLNYLILTIRVKDDKARALKLVKQALKKPYPRILKKDLEVWRDSLENLTKEEKANQKPNLKRAEDLIAKGKSQMDYPRDQSGMVYYIEASRVLKQLLVSTENPADQANVSYLLGLSELVIGNAFIGLEAQRYFEQAIRLQPKSVLAKRAFDLYEENLIYGYSGSSGLHLPASEKAKLEDLRKKAY
ncbi:MAG: hypothetical protein ACOH5I_03165 [Oligoflexus sp.]